MKTFRWKVKPGMDVASTPSVREVRFGDGYSQRACRAECQPENVQRDFLSPVGRPRRWNRFWQSTEAGKRFLWTPPYDWQIKVTCAKWTSRVSMLRVEFSAEFKQVVN
ncbi:phage tail protein [Escherichia coli]|uniref:phage tail protein n=1 Tax=Escherichia coli TaxID=562 RepID=UPI0019152798|nr:phage tail protein [Escherichia coli]GHK73494.1 tail protein [Escherichia coli]